MNGSEFSSIPLTQNCTRSASPFPFVNIVSYCYVLPCVCAAGLLGNIANLITLFSSRLKAVSYVYLRGLGIADMLCMTFVFVFVSFEILGASRYSEILSSYGLVWYRAHLMLPLINWTVSAGILIIVALTLERYVSISWPILFRAWNSPRRAVGVLTAAYAISLALYVPMCWQNEVVPQLTTNASCQPSGTKYGNASLDGEDGALKWTMTDNKLLLTSASYKAYKLTRETLVKFLPITALAFLNLRIIFVFKKVTKRKRRLSSSSNSATREQRSLLFLLAGIAVLFFICNMPAAFNLVFITETMKKQPSYTTFRAVANLLEIGNHALNFYNFCLCSSDYRMTFLRKFPCVKAVQERADSLKRRLSNSLMRAHGSWKMAANRVARADNRQSTSSLRSQLSRRGGRGQFLRRAVSSDVLLRLDHSPGSRPNRMYRPGASSGSSAAKDNRLPNGDKVGIGDASGPGRRKHYASAESFRIFDAIPEDSSNQQLGPLSTASVVELYEERRVSLAKRPAVSAIDFTESMCIGEYQILATDTSCSAETPFSAVSFSAPTVDDKVDDKEKETAAEAVNYDPKTDVLL